MALDQFRCAAATRGLSLDGEIRADGCLHRCAVEGGKGGRKDGSYLLHLDSMAAGGFQNFRDGLGWQDWRGEASRELSPAERAEWRRRMDAARLAKEADERARQAEAARRAARLWNLAKPATDANAYLRRKGVNAYGIRLLRRQLVIPARDADGVLWTLQFITEEGDKRFLTGGRKRGCYFAIGTVREAVCICEGYATAASIFEATGHATAVAFDAGNLAPVAQALRRKFPQQRLILCADNDIATPGNPGLSRAIEAARMVRGLVAVPKFKEAAT